MIKKIKGIGLVVALLLTPLTVSPLGSQMQPFMLTGEHWQQLSYDNKVLYIKGVGNMADYETQIQSQGRSRCVSAVLVEELRNKNIGEVVKEIDRYYQDNPGTAAVPVIEVLMRKAIAACPPAEKN